MILLTMRRRIENSEESKVADLPELIFEFSIPSLTPHLQVLYVRAEPSRLAQGISRFDKHFDIIEKLLAEVFPAENPYDLPSAGPFICGKKISLGDVALATSLVLALDFFPKVKYEVFKGRERLSAWWEAMNKDREFVEIRREMVENLKAVRERNRKIKLEQGQKAKL